MEKACPTDTAYRTYSTVSLVPITNLADLDIHVSHGLGNRLRHKSAAALAKKTNRQLVSCGNRMSFNATFHQLFTNEIQVHNTSVLGLGH